MSVSDFKSNYNAMIRNVNLEILNRTGLIVLLDLIFQNIKSTIIDEFSENEISSIVDSIKKEEITDEEAMSVSSVEGIISSERSK